jgi:hypothetical protein
MMDEPLRGTDRVTLRVWRVLNVLGWSVLAILLATFLRVGFESAADLFGRHSLTNVSDWLTYWEYAAFVVMPSSVVCGLFIGSLIGSEVAWKPIWVSGAAAVIFAAWSWFVMSVEPVPHSDAIKVIDVALLSVTVIVAMVVTARRTRHV